jgi:hypothetical protein
MKYRTHLSDMARQRAFGIIVDDQTLTWVSDPPGNDIAEPFTSYFTREGGGPIGSGRQFKVLPGGQARLA